MNLVQLNQLTDDELNTLLEMGGGICISLTMPVQQETDKRAENRIRLKNLIQTAQDKLAQLDLRLPEIEELLAPAEGLLRGGRFTANDRPGLAVYLSGDFSRLYQLPYPPEEGALVSAQFQIRPLAPLRLDEHFFVLEISQQGIRLLRATQYTVERMDLGDMPQSLAEALQWDDPEKQLQWHSKAGQAGNGRAAMFFGHGAGTRERQKVDLLRYFQLLDRGLAKILNGERAPMLVSGVDFLLPIFREANSYSHLLEESIEGSYDYLSDADLHEFAWGVVEPTFRREKEAAAALFQQQKSKDLASTDLDTVISAAHHGRVDALFVARDEYLWGEYDPQSGEIVRHQEARSGDSELLNLATIYALQNGGAVYLVPRGEVPDEAALAALLRF
jgi:hypothetical protein